MQKFAAPLVGFALLLGAPLASAAAVPMEEPADSVIRHGRDLDWHQPENTPYEQADEQRAFQEWMSREYEAWKSGWREPLNVMDFAVQSRRARRILTLAHREAVRTGDWSKKPILTIGRAVTPKTASGQRTHQRISRRHIVDRAQARNRVMEKSR